jgi:hypothetical protein
MLVHAGIPVPEFGAMEDRRTAETGSDSTTDISSAAKWRHPAWPSSTSGATAADMD